MFIPCDLKGYWQKDKRWADKMLGQSNASIGLYGCTVSSIATLGSWYCSDYTPATASFKWSFTGDGSLYWNSITEDKAFPMDFVYRYYSYDKQKIKDILYSESNSVVVAVNGDSHWVAITGYSSTKGFKCFDPFYNDYVYVLARYGSISGFAEFKLMNVEQECNKCCPKHCI